MTNGPSAFTYALTMALPAPKDSTTAVVTGASSGIGAEIARELSRRGHGVTLVARREDRLKALADELSQSHGVRVEVLAADLTDAALPGGAAGKDRDAAASSSTCWSTTPASRRWVPSARPPARTSSRWCEPTSRRWSTSARCSCRKWSHAIAVRVLNTASTAAFQPLPGQAAYGAAKAFVLSYGRALGAELRGTGVTVTTLCPGPVETGFAEAAGMTDAEASESLPKLMWVPAADVARAAVDGLAAGRPVVIPGMANRVARAAVAHVTPKSLILPLLVSRHPALKKASTVSSRPVPVSELELPSPGHVGDGARGRVTPPWTEAREQHWLARTEFGYTVTRLEDVTAVLRDRRFHSAVSAITELQGVGTWRARSTSSGGANRSSPWRASSTPACAASSRPHSRPASANRLRPTMRAVVGDLVDAVSGQGAVRVRRRRLRALPDPDHL